MAEPDDPAEAAARLETALARIAALAARVQSDQGAPGAVERNASDLAAAQARDIASRLDGLIAQLRAALSDPSGE